MAYIIVIIMKIYNETLIRIDWFSGSPLRGACLWQKAFSDTFYDAVDVISLPALRISARDYSV
jgi:hypothetical protein